LERRESYRFVIDMDRLRRDFLMNCINERSFVCKDRTFFRHGFSLNEPSTNGRRDGLGPREEEKKSHIQPKHHIRKHLVEEDDLGFCFGGEDEDIVEAVLTKGINLNNKVFKEDMEKLSQLCSVIVSQVSRKQSDSQLRLESSASLSSTPRSNKFLKPI
jgi:hypothetical protein